MKYARGEGPKSSCDPLSIRQLEVFVALVEQGSFTKAARHLGLSQSTVSGHMADLERRLGARLVDRDRTGVNMTAAGEVLSSHARDTLRAEANARMAIAQLNGLLTGRLVLGASSIPAVYLLPKYLMAFHRLHPAVTLHVETFDSEAVREAVAEGDVDVGLVGCMGQGESLHVSPLAGDSVVLVCNADHPLATCGNVSLDAIKEYPFVMREAGSGTRSAVTKCLEDAGLADVEFKTSCVVGSTEAAKSAARAGLGLAWVSDLSVRGEVQRGSLVVVPVDGVNVQRDFYLVTRSEDLVSPAGRAFRREVIDGTGVTS